MVKEKKILSYFVGWLILGFLIYIIGVSNVFADTVVENIGYVTSNTEVIISDKVGSGMPLYSSTTNTYTWDIKEIIVYVAYDFKSSTNYRLEISTPNAYLTNIDTVKIYNDDVSCNFTGLGDTDNGYPKIYFNCPSDTDRLNIVLSNSSDSVITTGTNFRWNYTYLSIISENGVDLSPIIDGQNQINDNITNSTNTITGSINDTENNINQNIDDMEQSIVESNKETQDVIKDQFNSCRDSVNLFNENIYTPSATDGYSLKNLEVGKNYTISINSNPNNSNYGFLIKISTGSAMAPDMWETYTNKSATFTYTQAMYDNDYKLYIIDTINYNPISIEVLKSLKIQLQEGSFATQYEPYGEEICQNKIDDTNNKLDGIQGALTDSSAPNMEILGDSAGWLPPGPLDVVLNLPLTMMNNLLSSLGRTCSTLRVNLPFVNKNIEIPCVESLMEQMGALVLWRWVGRIASVLILYSYLMNLYAWADKILTLRAEFDEAMGVDLANWGRL